VIDSKLFLSDGADSINTQHDHQLLFKERLSNSTADSYPSIMKKLLRITLMLVASFKITFGHDHPLFLVSRITEDNTWCMTAKSTDVSLELCDFENASPNQIWYRFDDESIATDDTKETCLWYLDDGDFFLAPCLGSEQSTPTWWPLYWRDETAVQLTDYENEKCVAPVTEIPTTGDKIKMLECQDDGRFAWHFHYATCDPMPYSYDLGRFCGDGGCLKAFNPTAANDSNQVKLVEEAISDVWMFDSWFDDALCFGSGQIRLNTNRDLCLQQGDTEEELSENVNLKVAPCECNNALQQFSCGYHPERPRLNPDLCMAANIGSKQVIFRDCNAADADIVAFQYYYGEEQVFPMPLIVASPGFPTVVRVGEPWTAGYDPTTDTFICLVQQADGNFRVLRSSTQEDCDKNKGDLVYHSRFSMPKLPNNEQYEYFTKLQRDGNLLTRKKDSGTAVWKTCSQQGNVSEDFWLVLNADETLSILNKNKSIIWNSAVDETCFYNRPLVLMSSPPNTPSVAHFGNPLVTLDRLTGYNICVIQQGDGNFRVLRGSDCTKNQGDRLFHSGLNQILPNNEKYFTQLQKDGNLVTRKKLSKQAVWSTCSSNPALLGDYFLVLTQYDTLAIVDKNFVPIWESKHNKTCFV